MKRILFVSMTACLISACLAGRPSPSEFRLWSKSGETWDDVKIALLECGANNPFGDVTLFPYPEERSLELHAMVYMCMIYSGYEYKSSRSVCKSFPDLIPCQRENSKLIPRRSQEKRLRSDFCRSESYSDFRMCRP